MEYLLTREIQKRYALLVLKQHIFVHFIENTSLINLRCTGRKTV